MPELPILGGERALCTMRDHGPVNLPSHHRWAPYGTPAGASLHCIQKPFLLLSRDMFKIIRVFIGTALGLWIASYFAGVIGIGGILNYLWATLIVMAAVFVLRGFHF